VQAASDLGIGKSTLDRWLNEDRAASADKTEEQVTESERAELKRLRKEVQVLRMERDILKKATAFFANHS
jgi:transposase